MYIIAFLFFNISASKAQFYIGPLIGYEKSAIHPVVNWDPNLANLYIDDRKYYNTSSYFYGLSTAYRFNRYIDVESYFTAQRKQVVAFTANIVPQVGIRYENLRTGLQVRAYPIKNISIGGGPTFRKYLKHSYVFYAHISDRIPMSSWGMAASLGLHLYNFSLEYQYHWDGTMRYVSYETKVINYLGFRHGSVGLSYRIKL